MVSPPVVVASIHGRHCFERGAEKGVDEVSLPRVRQAQLVRNLPRVTNPDAVVKAVVGSVPERTDMIVTQKHK